MFQKKILCVIELQFDYLCIVELAMTTAVFILFQYYKCVMPKWIDIG